ncbi:hypothetical protein BJ138DRAFT_1199843 [Hygrophoropsis aurantiaca]|uniref:Uncharacterized protein n=1 Tax=Hygrophoropsis aurantiaca TaxID=72124 RepID=A0ACB8A7U8_9AGAM|nr:hypothetical protein BJ138DRAFT_1199843 [Hygrophoropsis aurantiaca]
MTCSDERHNENANVSSEIIHTVTPTDTLPRLALRYGVPIAALRRANHLWPTDPIHLRTELVIPRDGVPLPKPKSTSIPQSHHSTHGSTITHTSSRPNVPPPHHPIAITSSFNLFDSIRAAFPARMSLDSMSSRTSLSEDADGSHEMNNFGIRHHVRRGSVRRRRRHRSRDDDLLDLSSDQDVDTDLDTSVNGDGGAFSGPAGPVPKHYLGHALQYADDEARGKSPFGFNSDIEHSSGNAHPLRTSGKRSSRVLDIRSSGLRIDPQPYTTNTRSQTQSETLVNPISPIRTSQLAPEPAMLFPVHRTQR